MRQAGAPKGVAISVTPIVFTCRHWLQKFRYKFVFG